MDVVAFLSVHGILEPSTDKHSCIMSDIYGEGAVSQCLVLGIRKMDRLKVFKTDDCSRLAVRHQAAAFER